MSNTTMIGPDQDEDTSEGHGGTAQNPESTDHADSEVEATSASELASSGELQELRQELASLNDRHLRLAAEFENYRRRSQAQLGDSGARAQAALIGRMLDALDDFHRVTSLDPETASVESVLEGVAMIERKLFQGLEEAGLEELNPEGEPFDPNVMEAMARAPARTEEEDETVDQVLQRGFRFAGHLVRPARVSVRKFE